MEFSDVLLEPKRGSSVSKGQPLLVGQGACNERGAAVYPDWSLRSVQQGRASSLAEVAGAVNERLSIPIHRNTEDPSTYNGIHRD